MDLLLRQHFQDPYVYRYVRVAIPVVVDLLLRPPPKEGGGTRRGSRNPCCSGPTASTPNGERQMRSQLELVAIPVVVDLLLRPSSPLK